MTIDQALEQFRQRVEDELVHRREFGLERIHQILQAEGAADLIRAYIKRLSYYDESLTPLDWLSTLLSCFWQRVSRVKPKSAEDFPIYIRAQLKWSAGDALRQHLKGSGTRSNKVRLNPFDVHAFQIDAIHHSTSLDQPDSCVAPSASSKLVSPSDAALSTFELHELKLCVFDQIHHNFRNGNRDILMLHALHELQPADIAAQVNKSARWVRKVLETNLPRLQQLVRQRCLGDCP